MPFSSVLTISFSAVTQQQPVMSGNATSAKNEPPLGSQPLLDLINSLAAETNTVNESRHSDDIVDELMKPSVSAASIIREAAKIWSFSFVELWVPTHDGNQLMFDADACMIHPQAPQSALALFRDSSKTIMFGPGEGIPGRVWSSSKHEILTNVQEAGHLFQRKGFSKFTGLKGAVALPVVCQSSVCHSSNNACSGKKLGVIVAFLEVPLNENASPETVLALIRPLQSAAIDLAHALGTKTSIQSTMGLQPVVKEEHACGGPGEQ